MGAPFPAFPAGRCVRHSLASGAPHNKTAGWTPGSVKPPRCTRLASVSTALDFGLADHAHAFASLGLRQNKARVSSASAATAPVLRRCAVRYWHRRAYGTFHLPSPGTGTPSLGGSWLRTLGRSSDPPPGFHFSASSVVRGRPDHPTFVSPSRFETFPGPGWFTGPTIAWPPSLTVTSLTTIC